MHGSNHYLVKYHTNVIKNDIPALSKPDRLIVKKSIDHKLVKDPISFGKPLQYSLKGHRSLRVGNWRVIYRIDITTHTVFIVAIKHRRYVYQKVQ